MPRKLRRILRIPSNIVHAMRAEAVQHTRQAPSGWWKAIAPDYATLDGGGKRPKMVYLGGRFKTQELAAAAVVEFWAAESRDIAEFIDEREVNGKRLFIPSVGQYKMQPWGGYMMFLASESRLLAEAATRALLFALFAVHRRYPPRSDQ